MNHHNNRNLYLVSGTLIFINAFLWFLLSYIESNFSIFLVHIGLLVVTSFIVLVLAKSIFGLFLAGVTVRSIMAAAAWLASGNSSRRFDVGTNQDSSIFWDRASWGLHRLNEVHDYPLFPAVNMYLYEFSNAFGSPAYLTLVQLPLIAGALAGVFAFIFVTQIATQSVARIVAMLFIFSPISVTFSTGVMRDTLICMSGLLVLASMLKARASGAKSFKFWLWSASGVLGLIALFYLRVMSFYLILVQALLMLFLLMKTSRLFIACTLSVLVGSSLAFYGLGDRVYDDTIAVGLEHSRIVRGVAADADQQQVTDAINNEGLTSKIFSSPLLVIPLAPLPYFGKVPFFDWAPPPWNPGPVALMDVVQGLGGLFNQLILIFYILACLIWIKFRDKIGIIMGIGFTLSVGVLMLLSFGHSRVLMSHGYLFFFYGVGVALEYARLSSRRSANGIAFFGWMVFLALGYLTWFLRSIEMNIFLALYAALSLLVLLTLVYFLIDGLRNRGLQSNG